MRGSLLRRFGRVALALAPFELAFEEHILRGLLPGGKPDVPEELACPEDLGLEKRFALQARLTFAGELAFLVQLVKRFDELVLLEDEGQDGLEHLFGRGPVAVEGNEARGAQ